MNQKFSIEKEKKKNIKSEMKKFKTPEMYYESVKQQQELLIQRELHNLDNADEDITFLPIKKKHQQRNVGEWLERGLNQSQKNSQQTEISMQMSPNYQNDINNYVQNQNTNQSSSQQLMKTERRYPSHSATHYHSEKYNMQREQGFIIPKIKIKTEIHQNQSQTSRKSSNGQKFGQIQQAQAQTESCSIFGRKEIDFGETEYPDFSFVFNQQSQLQPLSEQQLPHEQNDLNSKKDVYLTYKVPIRNTKQKFRLLPIARVKQLKAAIKYNRNSDLSRETIFKGLALAKTFTNDNALLQYQSNDQLILNVQLNQAISSQPLIQQQPFYCKIFIMDDMFTQKAKAFVMDEKKIQHSKGSNLNIDIDLQQEEQSEETISQQQQIILEQNCKVTENQQSKVNNPQTLSKEQLEEIQIRRYLMQEDEDNKEEKQCGDSDSESNNKFGVMNLMDCSFSPDGSLNGDEDLILI